MVDALFTPPFNNRGLFDDHYLDPDNLSGAHTVKGWLNKAACPGVLEAITDAWRVFRRHNPGTPTEPTTEKQFLTKVLDALGWSWDDQVAVETEGRTLDFALFTSEERRGNAPTPRGSGRYWKATDAICEGKKWDLPLDADTKRSRKDGKPYYPPVRQTLRYLHLVGAEWGILTNGALWRLYHHELSIPRDGHARGNVYEVIDATPSRKFGHYEFDLDGMLRDDDHARLGYLLSFFHAAAYAHDRKLNSSLIDRVLRGSQKASEQAKRQSIHDARTQKQREERLEKATEAATEAADRAADELARSLWAEPIVRHSVPGIRRVLLSAYSKGIVDRVMERLSESLGS